MQCPVCDERMKTIIRAEVEIDICPACKGIWLERGELDKLLEQEGGQSTPAADRARKPEHTRESEHHDHDHDHDQGHGSEERRVESERGAQPKRKGSWLGDILGGLGEGGGD